MDAIKSLARLAATKKSAALPSATGKGLSLLGRLGRTAAPLVSKPPAISLQIFPVRPRQGRSTTTTAI